jgi:hypothetical protein
MDLIANSYSMASKHSDIARRFIALEQEINLTIIIITHFTTNVWQLKLMNLFGA